MSIVRIENHTDQLVYFPPLTGIEREHAETGEAELVDFPQGIRLLPGLNSVPSLYMDSWRDETRKVCDKQGKPRLDRTGKEMVRYPGREALQMLCQPVTFTTASGMRFGPRVTVHAAPLADRADGPAAPSTLPSKPQAALAIINACDARAALDRWLKAAPKDVGRRVAIQARLAELARGAAA